MTEPKTTTDDLIIELHFFELCRIVEEQLIKLRESGYIVPENPDNEVAQAINATAFSIATAAQNLMRPDEYIKLGSSFYRVADTEALSSRESQKLAGGGDNEHKD